MRIRLIHIFSWLALLSADLLVYVIFGLLLMRYDDKQDGRVEPDSSDRLVTAAFLIWNMLHVALLIYVSLKIYKGIRQRKL